MTWRSKINLSKSPLCRSVYLLRTSGSAAVQSSPTWMRKLFFIIHWILALMLRLCILRRGFDAEGTCVYKAGGAQYYVMRICMYRRENAVGLEATRTK